MINLVIRTYHEHGFIGLLFKIIERLLHLFPQRAKSFYTHRNLFFGAMGIEVGGKSQIFSKNGIFPVYPIVGQLDNCLFCNLTVWHGNINEGYTFQFNKNKPNGRQYITEATLMDCIPSGTYDFVLSSHMLEHTANPILALTEWIRLLKDKGILVLLLPHKEGTFDHRRPLTTLDHLISDFNAATAEDDLTHLPEILALHDLERDPMAGDFESFKSRSLKNFENRCLHHHVFDTRLAVKLVDYMKLKILTVEAIWPMHILIISQKIPNGEIAKNFDFSYKLDHVPKSSPFSTDRMR
ncbi:MAG: methyltransferase domain-containing protein [Proteobacteria bacterium]|nr:methyltransferase domain-containing protein [Pseudomonadota bacterium]